MQGTQIHRQDPPTNPKPPTQGAYVNRPLVVYYDHACMLERYCLARDPWLFRNVIFIIDKFHLSNHTCPCSFAYYEFYGCFAEFTQVCEQGSFKNPPPRPTTEECTSTDESPGGVFIWQRSAS